MGVWLTGSRLKPSSSGYGGSRRTRLRTTPSQRSGSSSTRHSQQPDGSRGGRCLRGIRRGRLSYSQACSCRMSGPPTHETSAVGLVRLGGFSSLSTGRDTGVMVEIEPFARAHGNVVVAPWTAESWRSWTRHKRWRGFGCATAASG